MTTAISEQQIKKSINAQLKHEVHERNTYRSLLTECLATLKSQPTQAKLATKISSTLNQYT